MSVEGFPTLQRYWEISFIQYCEIVWSKAYKWKSLLLFSDMSLITDSPYSSQSSQLLIRSGLPHHLATWCSSNLCLLPVQWDFSCVSPPPRRDANMFTKICYDSFTLCGFVSANRDDIELSESLPLRNEENTWSCQCRDHSWCLTTLLKWLNYIPINQQKVWNELQLFKQGNRGICTSNYRED